MTLEQQLQLIVDDAADHGIPPIVIEKAIAPVLRLFAEQLHHLEYYILQNLTEDWVLTTIANPKLQLDKKVIYAFVSVRDAAAFQGKVNPDLVAIPIPVVQLLFRFFALQQVDSIIFLEDLPNLNQGIEIEREQLSHLIRQQIEQLNRAPRNFA